MKCSLPGFSVHESSGKNTGVGCHALLQSKANPLLFLLSTFYNFLGDLFLYTHFKNHFIYFKDKVSSQENLQFVNCCCSCLVTKSFLTLCNPMDCRPAGFSLHRISRQEYWNELPFPSPGDLPNPGTELASLALAGEFFTTESPRKPSIY